MHRTFRSFAVAIIVAACVLVTPARSDASFIAAICEEFACLGGGLYQVTDGGLLDTNLAPGIIDFFYLNPFLGFSAFIRASSKPASEQPSMGLEVLAFDDLNPEISRILVVAADTDFTTVDPLSGHLFGTSTGTGSIRAGIVGGFNNEQFPFGGGTFTPSLAFGGDFDTFDATVFHSAANVDLYSMTIGIAIGTNSSGTVTDAEFQVRPVSTPPPPTTVPEPTSLMLLGAGLACASKFRRRSLSRR